MEDPTVRPAGVEETERLSGGRLSPLITYLDNLPTGTVLTPSTMVWFGSAAKVKRALPELAHPVSGWVSKSEQGRWIVTHQNRNG